MPKISNQSKYPEQEIVNRKDYVIGTDYYDRKKTKTFPIQNLAQVLADILIEDGGIKINVGKTSQLINDGEFGDSRFVEENELQENIENIVEGIIISQLQPQYFNFNNQTTVVCDHGLQKIPKVTIMIGTEEVFADIEHTPDMNSVVVTFSNTRTGIIIIQ